MTIVFENISKEIAHVAVNPLVTRIFTALLLSV